MSYRAFYYETFPIELLDHFAPPPVNGIQTGGMPIDEFEALTESVKNEGFVNPIVVEDNNTVFKVQIGNNRVWVAKHMGHDTIKTVLITKNNKEGPIKGGEEIPKQFFASRMGTLHPMDDTWNKSHYARMILAGTVQEDE